MKTEGTRFWTVCKRLLLVAFASALLTPSSRAGEAQGAIVLSVSGFEHERGKLLVFLYDREDGFPTKIDKAMKRAAVPIVDKQVELEIPGLKPGDYALSVVHDENDNGKLDTNFLGIPKEPLGVSNNAKGSFGPPKWRDARFSVRAGARALKSIVLKRI